MKNATKKRVIKKQLAIKRKAGRGRGVVLARLISVYILFSADASSNPLTRTTLAIENSRWYSFYYSSVHYIYALN